MLQAAADAKRIGFDGIELHAAHGALLHDPDWAAKIREISPRQNSVGLKRYQ